MSISDLKASLNQALEDLHFSRKERQGLVEALKSEADRERARQHAFELARTAFASAPDPRILDWLEEVVKATRDQAETANLSGRADAYFSPGDDCVRSIQRIISQAHKSLDICVFTITDDRLTETLEEAFSRSVAIRIITDNDKASDLGSDIGRLESAGIRVRVDRSPYHMHHKFAIADMKTLLTGSYNWTRGAARDNQENLVVTDDVRLLSPFAKVFDQLWESLS